MFSSLVRPKQLHKMYNNSNIWLNLSCKSVYQTEKCQNKILCGHSTIDSVNESKNCISLVNTDLDSNKILYRMWNRRRRLSSAYGTTKDVGPNRNTAVAPRWADGRVHLKRDLRHYISASVWNVRKRDEMVRENRQQSITPWQSAL